MTRQELDDTETALVDVASARAHIETALTFLEHDRGEQAEIELRYALAYLHRVKLRVMILRWMGCPNTLGKLIEEQMKWLKRRYPA